MKKAFFPIFIFILIVLSFWFLREKIFQDKPEAIPVEKEKNIYIDSPKAGEIVGERFYVVGRARVFENVLQIRISRQDEIIFEDQAYAQASDVGQFGEFKKEINLSGKSLMAGKMTIEAFDYSPKDGSERDKTAVSIRFVP